MTQLPSGPNYEYENQQIVHYEESASQQSSAPQESAFDIAGMLKRRWLVVVLISLPIIAAGSGYILFFMPKMFKTQAAIEIAPIATAILYADSESERPMPNYEAFKNTEAVRIGSDTVLNRVADELYEKKLKFFEGTQDPRMRLRNAVQKEEILIEHRKNTNLILLQMTSEAQYYRQAEMILNSIVRNYWKVAVESEKEGENTKLTNLETERKTLLGKMDNQREVIRQLVDEFGTGELTSRQEVMFEQVASLQRELIGVDIKKMALETQIQLQKNTHAEDPLSTELLNRKQAIIQADPILQGLRADIQRYEEMVLVSLQNMAEKNPELIRRKEMLQSLKARYQTKLEEVTREVDKNLEVERSKSGAIKLADLENQLQQTVEYEKRLQDKIKQQDEQTITMGRKQFTINDQKEQLEQTKTRLNEIVRRIEELNIESKRPARISIAIDANSVPVEGKAPKMIAAVLFAGCAMGFGVAFLMEKLDKRLHEPDDISRRIGVRIIGTTTNPGEVERKYLGQQLSDDYQTIRANLGLLEQHENIKIIVVSSAGKGDGKTTFSINLASSFTRTGKKVLLIDGDLRKPDVSVKLGLSSNVRGLQDYLFGADLAKTVYQMNGDGLSILAADERNTSDAGDLLSQKSTHERVHATTKEYDVVIIDTPPVLAFVDALLWAKMADGVILVSYVGKTSRPEMRQALERFTQAGVKVLGTVINNVKMHQNYRRYGYGYGYAYGRSESMQKAKARASKSSHLLLTTHDSDTDNKNNADEHV